MDCSATHRSMGVHLTFVRSVDLDEWTQRQIDAMRLGGNENAREYFRKHGFTDFHGKMEKKYKSKAAQSYRVELAKLVEAAAVQRGEAALEEVAALYANNLSLDDPTPEATAGMAMTSGSIPVAQPSAKLASELPGAKGGLKTPPSSGSGPKLVLRKLSSGASSTSSAGKNLLKKKPVGTTKLRVNKLAVGGDLEAPPDPDTTEEEGSTPDPEPVPQVAKLVVVPPPAPPKSPSPKATAPPKAATMDDHIDKLKSMNQDFFSGF